MLITAHGGANNTGRNSKKFFDDISSYNVDVIEVDIWKLGQKLYLSHLPSLPRLKLPLTYAFRFIKKHNFKINCDVKQSGMVKDVLAVAKQENVLDRIIFTGSVSARDIAHLDNSQVYLNKGFFKLACPRPKDVRTIAKYIQTLNCPSIAGINFKHTYLSDAFLTQCQKYGLNVSTFVVNTPKDIDRLLQHKVIVNITTDTPSKLLRKCQRTITK